jgi:hypothetical protein
MKQYVIILISTLSLLFNANSQSRWIQHYMENKNAPVLDLNVAYDNGYLLSGWITPSYPPYSWLIKTDFNGDVLWQKLIGGINGSSVCVYKISQNISGELFLGGCNISQGDVNPLIIKLNACGEKEWCRELITSSMSDFYFDLVCTNDGGSAALVYGAFTPIINRAGILRFSSDGELLWQQYYQGEDPSVFAATLTNLVLTPDQGFLMTGFCYYPDPDPNNHFSWLHPYYIKTDSMGIFEWETIVHKESGDVGGEAFMTLVNPSQNFYYSCISHYYTSDTLNTTRPAIVKLDLQGNVMGVYDLVHGNYDLGKIMTFDFINNSILTGSASWENEEDNPQSRVITFDTLGQIADSATIADDHFLGFTKVTYDGKILIFKSNFEANDHDPTLYKLTQNLEQDTFYTAPFTYDSLCSYQIAWDTIVPDDCGVIVGIEEEGGGEAWGQGGGEAGKQGNLEVWPNPASGVLSIKVLGLSKCEDCSLLIYDVFGSLAAIPGSSPIQINPSPTLPQTVEGVSWVVNVSSLPPGLYFAVVKDEVSIVGNGKFVVGR